MNFNTQNCPNRETFSPEIQRVMLVEPVTRLQPVETIEPVRFPEPVQQFPQPILSPYFTEQRFGRYYSGRCNNDHHAFACEQRFTGRRLEDCLCGCDRRLF